MSSLGGFNLCDFPAAEAPEGQSSNFVDPQSGSAVIIAICVVMVAAAIVSVVGRLIANWQKLTWSDYACFVALVCSIAYGALTMAQMNYARHQWDIPACWLLGTYGKLIFSQQMFYVVSIFSSKASLFLLFYRIFTVESGKSGMRLCIRLGLGASFALYFTSIPVEAYYNAPSVGQSWDDVMITGKPMPAIYWGLVQSCLSIVLDAYIFVLPLPAIAQLTMSVRDRIKVAIVFSTAFTAVIASIVSLAFRVLEFKHMTTDGTWYLWPIFLCAVVEINVAIIVSSVPAFSKFVRLYICKWGPVKQLRSKLSSWLSGHGSDAAANSRNRPRTGRDRPPINHAHLDPDSTLQWGTNAFLESQPGLSEPKRPEQSGAGQTVHVGTLSRESSGEIFALQGVPTPT